jgi:GNAT superfamily N-acetyltransferase
MEFRNLSTIDDIDLASSLVWTVFSEFVAPGYSQEGIETFRKFIQPEELEKSLESKSFFMLGCFEGEKLVGVMAMRDFYHVSLFFVDKVYHRKGIAKELFSRAMKQCIQGNSDFTEITVNSSPYAVEIYKKLGFVDTGEKTTKNGITFIPMKMNQ